MRFMSAISDGCSWIEIENIIDELKPISVQDLDGLRSGGREAMLLEEVVKETFIPRRLSDCSYRHDYHSGSQMATSWKMHSNTVLKSLG
jgi:hypothetical protein